MWVYPPGAKSAPTLLNNTFTSNNYLAIYNGKLYGGSPPKSMPLAGGPTTAVVSSPLIDTTKYYTTTSLAAAPDGSAIYFCDGITIVKIVPDSTPGYASKKALVTGLNVALNSNGIALAVHPSTGDLYTASGASVVVLDSITGTQKSTACTNLQGGTVRALGFSSGGDLFLATDTSVIKVVGGSMVNGNTTIATNLRSDNYVTTPNTGSSKILGYGIVSLAVDNSSNVYVATPGYYKDGGSKDVKIYKLTAPSYAPTEAVSIPATYSYSPYTEYDTDASGKWITNSIATSGADLIVGWTDGTQAGVGTVFRLPGGVAASKVSVSAAFTATASVSLPIAAAGTTIYGVKYGGLPIIAACV
jgi:hypothetical protein